MNTTTFIVPGKPAGKARPRFNRKTGVVYSPDVGNFQARVAHEARAAGLTPREGPMFVTVLVYRQVPKSYSKKRCAALLGGPAVGRPDAANILAACHDALEGVSYFNDSQVSQTSFLRLWTDQGDRTEITVEQLEVPR